jgi:cytochrome c oxidase assembly factor CtaG
MAARAGDRPRTASPGAAVVVVGVVALGAVVSLSGWSGGDAVARFDPLLSLCLAARPGVTPADFWSSWSFAPQIVLPLLLAVLVYVRGAVGARPSGAQLGGCVAGMLLLALAVISPLCRLAATLASAHMVQHVLVVAAVPPLLVIGGALATMRRGLPLTGAAPEWLERPALACALYAAAIWLSHVPAIYQAALLEPAAHLLLLAFQLGAGLLFWQVMLGAAATAGDGRNARIGGALLIAFATFMHTNLLGALLSFASAPWYPLYELRPVVAWGLSPLADQQLAGVIMWVPMSTLYLAAGLALMARLLGVRETGAKPQL